MTKRRANEDPALGEFPFENVLFVEKWDASPDPALIIPKESMLMVSAITLMS